MKAELLPNAISIITCNKCRTVIAQDTGKPTDVSVIVNAVNSHLVQHQILF